MGLLDSIIGGVASIGSSLIGAQAAKNQQAREQEWSSGEAVKNRDFQASEAEKQRDWNLQMFNLENEYNSPEQQLQRLLATGMNPATAIQSVSGQGAALGQVQGSGLPAGSQATVPGSVASTLGNIWSQAGTSTMQNISQLLQNRQQELDLKWKPFEKQANYRSMTQSVQESISRMNLNKQEEQQINELLPLYKDMTRGQIDVLNQSIKESMKKVDVMSKQLEVLDQDIAESQSRVEVNEAQKGNIEAKTEVEKQNVYLVKADTAKAWAEQGLINAEKLTEDALRAGRVELTAAEAKSAIAGAFKNNVESVLKELAIAKGYNPNEPGWMQAIDKYTQMLKGNFKPDKVVAVWEDFEKILDGYMNRK